MKALLILMTLIPLSLAAQTGGSTDTSVQDDEWIRQEQEAQRRAEERRQLEEAQATGLLEEREQAQMEKEEEAATKVQVECVCPPPERAVLIPMEQQEEKEEAKEEPVKLKEVVPTSEQFESQKVPGWEPIQKEEESAY